MTNIVFMGTPDFAVKSLQALLEAGYNIQAVVTQPDRPVGRKRTLTPPPVKKEALQHHIPVFQPEKIAKDPLLDEILALEPDLIVTAAFGQLLPKRLLDAPKHGCINVHASLLPELRGGAPIHHAILQGKKEAGVTIMYMVEKLDAGDMISKVRVPITDEDNVGTMHEKLADKGAQLLVETLPKLLAGDITATPQNEEEATFAPNIKKEDERIVWTRSSEEVWNHVRGLQPWPVAYTMHRGERFKLWEVRPVPSPNREATPGTVVGKSSTELIVQTGAGEAVSLLTVQPAGKKPMEIANFLQGAGSSLQVGDVLPDVD